MLRPMVNIVFILAEVCSVWNSDYYDFKLIRSKIIYLVEWIEICEIFLVTGVVVSWSVWIWSVGQEG